MTVISLRKKYIFIANMKTASTTIHHLLKKDNPDIISFKSVHTKPIGKHDNYIKIKNYLKYLNYNIDDFYIFGFIREPSDRLISCFKHDIKGNYINKKYGLHLGLNQNSLSFYIENGLEQHFRPFKFMFCNENGYLPNNVKIFKYENLSNAINEIFNNINIKIPNKIPMKNNSKLKIRLSINNSLSNIIKNRYKFDCEKYI
jgi:hypothetical protein